MQLKKSQLQRQQVIMSKLGFYRHKCDGIWGPASIEAKKKWESKPDFIPGLPTNGLPFGDRDYVPSGVRFDKTSRMFTLSGLTAEEIEQYMPKESEPVAAETEPKPESDTKTSTADVVDSHVESTADHPTPTKESTVDASDHKSDVAATHDQKQETRSDGPQFNPHKKKHKNR
jgi:hypothetical protein